MNARRGLGPRRDRHDGRMSTQGAVSSSPAPDPGMQDGPSDAALDEALTIEGVLVALVVDGGSGLVLRQRGQRDDIDPDIAAAGMTDVVRSQVHTIVALGREERIDDVLITTGSTYYLARCVPRHEGFFVLLLLDRSRANIAMARRRLGAIAEDLAI